MGYMRWEPEKDIFWLQTLEELEEMDASELHARRLNAKEIITPKICENLVSREQMEQLNCLKRWGFPKIHPNTGPSRTRRRA